MNSEDVENKRKRLIYRAWHRGTREMDLLLGSFADKNVAGFDENELAQFELLLEENDPDLYDWVTGKAAVPADVGSEVFGLLMKHKYV